VKKSKLSLYALSAAIFILAFAFRSFAEPPAAEAAPQPPAAAPQPPAAAPQPAEPAKAQMRHAPAASENVTLDFKEADIKNVLKIISYKSGVNIVTTPEVMGNVSIRLIDVPWELALDIILKTYGFGSQKQGNVILVTKMENVARFRQRSRCKQKFSL
jgi:type IV pilus assembly protein PilQ